MEKLRESFVSVAESFGFNQTKEGAFRTMKLDDYSLRKIRKIAKSNMVHTSKYNAINFVPLNLLQQFKKVANVYFLFIMYLQTISMITITNGSPTMAPPLLFVVIISMIKDAFEDYTRHTEDDKENNSTAIKVVQGREEEVKWGEILVGDVLLVRQN